MMKNLAQAAMMINKYIPVFLLFIVLTLPISIIGNAQTFDFRLRGSVKIQKDFTKKITASIEYEHRLDNYLTTFDLALIEPSISFDIIKPLSVGAEWRFMADQDIKRSISFKQRGAFFIRFKKTINDFDLKFRTAIQYGFDDLTNYSSNNRKKIINRNSFSVDYNWFGSRFTPFAGYEFFYHINHPRGGIINQWRLKIGCGYKTSKSSDIYLNYIFENEFNIANPVDAHVIGFGFSFKF